MQKIILGLFTVLLLDSSLNADNKPMSDDDFMKQFMQLEQREKNATEIIKAEKTKIKALDKKFKKEQDKTKALEEKAKKQRARTQALEKITKALEKAKN